MLELKAESHYSSGSLTKVLLDVLWSAQAVFFAVLGLNAFYPIFSTTATFSLYISGVVVLFNPLLISLISGFSIPYFTVITHDILVNNLNNEFLWLKIIVEMLILFIINIFTLTALAMLLGAFVGSFLSAGVLLTSLTFGIHTLLPQVLGLGISLPASMLWLGLITTLTRAELILKDNSVMSRELIAGCTYAFFLPSIMVINTANSLISQLPSNTNAPAK